MNNEELWDEFKGYIERLIGLAAYLDAPGKKPAGTDKVGVSAADILLRELARQMRDRQLVCAAALGYGLLAILRSIIGRGASGSLAEDLAFVHWGLDRKLKEQYRILGASEVSGALDDAIWRLGEISQGVLSRTAPGETGTYIADNGFDAGRLASAIIEENYLFDDFRSLIGVNVFDDVTWFNKEAFESALFYGKLFLVLENDSAFTATQPWLDRVALIAEVSGAMEKAKQASGYRLDSLIRLLAGEAPDEKKPVRKKAKPAKENKKE